MKLALLSTALVSFSVFTVEVMISHGPVGFIPLAMAHPWAMQMLLDLTIMATFVGVWLFNDAKKLGLNGWFYLFLLPAGSIGLLIYLVRRAVHLRPQLNKALSV